MKTANPDKSNALERIDFRVSKELKELISRAAELSGSNNLTSYIVAALREKSLRVVEEHERILLSNRDWARLMTALENPPEPSEALRRAADNYGKLGFE